MKQNRTITLFAIIMLFALLVSTLIAMFSIRKISKEHTSERLSMISKDMERSINDELSQTINVSKTIANDTMLTALLEQEEEMGTDAVEEQMAAYTSRLENVFSYQWVFIASEKTKAYYSSTGLYQILDPETEEDSWYADFVNQDKEYEVTVGRDNDVPDTWTFFADVRIENREGELLGVCGVAMPLSNLQTLIRDYENEYDADVLFVDRDGEVQLGSKDVGNVTTPVDFEPVESGGEQVRVHRQGWRNTYTITKYMDQFDWYMVISNFDPFDQTADFFLIVFTGLSFLLVILITVICLRYILKRSHVLYLSSYGDELTGLYNRRAYEDQLKEYRKQGSFEKVTVIVFDVNGLKLANDRLGHSAGDELIRGAAEVIRKVFEPYGKCYRTGGDEFVVFLEQCDTDILALTKQLEQLLSEWSGELVKELSVSYGIASGQQESDLTLDELTTLADERMYWQKRNYYKASGNDRRRA